VDGRSATLTNSGAHEFIGGRLVLDAPNGARQFIVLPTLAPGATARVDAAGAVTILAAPAPALETQRPLAAR
jgi:hypothetical protein